MTPTTKTPEMLIALTSIHLEQGMIAKGDQLPADDPRVRGRSAYFAPANTSPQQLRQLEADLFAGAVGEGWQPPPAPKAIPMRALRDIVVERTVEEIIPKGSIVASDSDEFILNARFFERAD